MWRHIRTTWERVMAVQRNRILVIEDDPAVARSLRAGLARDGYAVTCHESGSEGIAHARAHLSDLILLDVRLPDLSGLDVCRQIRQLGLRQPVIMLTVRGEETDKVLGLDGCRRLCHQAI
jgi:DNA-binding response OmpR family regulator